jgi:hypothetical protein
MGTYEVLNSNLGNLAKSIPNSSLAWELMKFLTQTLEILLRACPTAAIKCPCTVFFG